MEVVVVVVVGRCRHRCGFSPLRRRHRRRVVTSLCRRGRCRS